MRNSSWSRWRVQNSVCVFIIAMLRIVFFLYLFSPDKFIQMVTSLVCTPPFSVVLSAETLTFLVEVLRGFFSVRSTKF